MQNTHVKKHGFTIVELLIAIVVVAILAAISIAAYTNVQNRAHNSAVQSDLRNIATKFELYKAEFGRYPESFDDLSKLGLTVSKPAYEVSQGIHYSPPVYNVLYCRSAYSTQFGLIARAKSGDVFQITHDSPAGVFSGGIPASATALCDSVGIEGALDAQRIWLYYANAWRI